MRLPTAKEINPHNALDGICAEKNFLGKSLDEAEALFRENFLKYQEDLMWMGPIAFCFYLPAAIRYVDSPDVRLDGGDVRTMLNLLRFRWEHDREAILDARVLMLRYCQGVLDRITQMDIWWEIDGDIESDCRTFISLLHA